MPYISPVRVKYLTHRVQYEFVRGAGRPNQVRDITTDQPQWYEERRERYLTLTITKLDTPERVEYTDVYL
jgi:hypothetical protein